MIFLLLRHPIKRGLSKFKSEANILIERRLFSGQNSGFLLSDRDLATLNEWGGWKLSSSC